MLLTRGPVERPRVSKLLLSIAVTACKSYYIMPSRLLFVLLITTLLSCRERPLFERIDATDSGLTFANTITESDSLNVLDFEYIYNGGGVGVGDVNNDGLPDVFFSGNQVPNRLYLNRGNRDGGPLQFEDVTEQAGITHRAWSTGVSMVDINADGLLDIYVCTINPKRGAEGAPNLLYLNEGLDANKRPHFREVAHEVGLDDRSYSTQAAFFDYDRDGDLDCYLLTNGLETYNRNLPRGPQQDGTGKSTDRLYENLGDTINGERDTDSKDRPASVFRSPSLRLPAFKNISREAGITTEGWGLGVAIADLNDDGWPDVYCANDFQSNDLLWINNAGKPGLPAFSNRLSDYMKHESYNAMGLDVADLNNDGLPELMTLDMFPEDNRRQKSMFSTQNVDRFQLGLDRGYQPQYVRNVLQLNRGKDPTGQVSFSEIGQLAGVHATDWSWSTLMADFDNDGYRDIFVTNGYPKDITDLDFVAYNNQYKSSYFDTDSETDRETREKMTELIGVKKSNFMFRNRAAEPDGELRFEDVTDRWGLQLPSFSNGAAYADFDNDGDLDIVVNNIDDAAFLYRNRAADKLGFWDYLRHPLELWHRLTGDAKPTPNYLRVKLIGGENNRAALGAKVDVYADGQHQAIEQSPYRGYKSTVDPTLHFGLGHVGLIDSVVVRWLNGQRTVRTRIPVNQTFTINQANALPRPSSPSSLSSLFFSISPPLSFTHHENFFVDFKEQVLLPHRYSQGGPCMAVGDVDGNGLDDLFIGAAVNGTPALFRQVTAGQFVRDSIPKPRRVGDDMGAVFFDADNDKDLDLYVVTGGNEYPANHEFYQDRLYRNDGRGHFTPDPTALPNTRASGSCVVAADYDRDGDTDLFVGGRVLPRQFPLPARSYLLRNDSRPGTPTRFTDVTETVATGLAQAGMVTAALWTDANNDRQPDLLIAGEFMAPTLFTNGGGLLKQSTPQSLNKPGLYNALAQGDFDHDGDMDYMAGNFGINARYQVSEAEPITVHAKDYDNNGTLDPILCYFIQGKCHPAHPRDQLAEQVPGLKKRFPTYADYGRMTFEEILTAEERRDAYEARATDLRSSYIENRGNGQFVVHSLPILAQLAPVNAILARDFNNDGHLDVLLAGNDYSTDTNFGRYDAAKGLLLTGDGKGGFKPQSMAQSGFCADHDAKSLVEVRIAPNRSLLVVGNNNEAVQTFVSTYSRN